MSSILLFLPCLLEAQQKKIDSLVNVLKTSKEDTTRVKILYTLCRGYTNAGNYVQAMLYAKQEQELALKLNYQKGLASSYSGIGLIYLNQGDFEKAEENHLIALKKYTKIRDKQGISSCYTNMGLVFWNQGNYEKALQNYFKSLKIGEEVGDKRGIAMVFNNIGLIYWEQGDYEKSLQNHFKSLKIKEEIGYKKGIAMSLGNIGLIYWKYEEYEKALDNYLKGLKIYEEIGDKQGIASSYGNIANIYFSQSNYEKSLETHLKSLKINEEIGNMLDIATCYYNIGSIYSMKGKLKESNYFLNKSLILYKKIGSKDGVKDAYSALSELYDKKGDYKQAYNYNKLYSDIKDTLLNEQSSKQMAELQIKYDTEKKEKQILLLNNENKIKALEISEQQVQLFNNKILFVALFAGIILITVISWLLISRNRIRQKEILKTEDLKQQQLRTKAIIETQEQERKRIAQDLHDGIGHKLTILKFNFEKLIGDFRTISQEQRIIFEQTENLLDETHKEVRTLSHSMMPRALQERDLADAVSDLVEQTFANSKIKYSLKNDLPAGFPENIQICLYRVLQELLNNILKYAQATEVAVQIFKNKNTIILFVEDNGIAIQNKNLANGIGLHNIAGRINVLNGVFAIEPGPVKGTVATIRIPLPQLK